jgi:hypothetical protein
VAQITIDEVFETSNRTVNADGAVDMSDVYLAIRYAPLWQPTWTDHVHMVPFMAITDVQQTFGYLDPMEAAQHLLLDHNVHTLRQPQSAAEVSSFMEGRAALVRSKLETWQATEKMLVSEAKITPITTKERMVHDIGALAAPGEMARKVFVGGAVGAVNPNAAKAVERQAAARGAHGAAFDGHGVTRSGKGYGQLRSLIEGNSGVLDELLHANYRHRYGRQVAFAVDERIRFAQQVFMKAAWRDPDPIPTVEPEPDRPYDPGVGGTA